MEFAIETTNLYKEFHPDKHYHFKDKQKKVVACDDINLKVRKGELFGLAGPNGAGKTTLLKILATIVFPDKGEVIINGYNLLKEDYRVRESIGLMTSETKSFYGRLSGRENLYFFANLYNLFSTDKKKRVEELAELLGIDNQLGMMFQQYSTGIKQRLAIVRGLLNDAPILLIDEPTKSLDPISAEDLRKFIRVNLINEKGKTVIFTSHSLSELESLADTIAVMNKGRITAQGTLPQLKESLGAKSCTIEQVFKHYTQD